MSIGDYKQAKVKEIIEDAISQLMAVGATSDTAASLLVIQGAIRIEDPDKRTVIAKTVAELLQNPTD